MNLTETQHRFHLSPTDLTFVAETLATGTRDRAGVLTLLADPASADAVLDQPALLRRVLDGREQLAISAFLYFYLLVRAVFREHGLDDPDLADHVAEALASYREDCGPTEGRSPLPFAVDLFEAIERAAGAHERFYLQVRAGNLLLVASGLFPDHLRARAERRGAPGLRYYEECGASAYQRAGQHPLAREFCLAERLEQLGTVFPRSRRALNRVAEEYLVWN
jgi:hypothetical protein